MFWAKNSKALRRQCNPVTEINAQKLATVVQVGSTAAAQREGSAFISSTEFGTLVPKHK